MSGALDAYRARLTEHDPERAALDAELLDLFAEVLGIAVRGY